MSDGKKHQVVTVRMSTDLHGRLVHEAWARQTSLNRLCILLLSGKALPERQVPEKTFALDEIRGSGCDRVEVTQGARSN